ncbi:MAG: maleylpyruvate isomerase family mycothiol-dependent enzyme [Aeromicrobium sp.]|uniref:maleylpyruvate isomerase family mycothiol-dependent enzyme n=1 Tax=Aeromicrobium sp. TaxID=1871063 RepID=UPI0039E467F5
MERWDLIAAERRAFADLIDSLTPEQLASPSLCGEWTVKHVAAHVMVGPTASVREVAMAMVRARFSFDRANTALAEARVGRPVAELTAAMRDHAESHFSPPGMDWRAPLADIVIHRRDAAVPLGIEIESSPEVWPIVLDLLVAPKTRKAFGGAALPAVRLEATDVDWSHGEEGPVVQATAESLALALSGRADLLPG